MARLLAILTALRRAVLRDLGTFGSVKVNNFFLFVALMVYAALNSGQAPKSAEPLILLLGLVVLFPLSSDPLAKIPPVRLAMWPLTSKQRIALRAGALFLSPVLWITVVILLKTANSAAALSLLAVAIPIHGLVSLSGNRLPYVPLLPWRLGGLVGNNLRELLSLLDPYLAALLSVLGCAYRYLYARPEPAAFPVIALLVALALSTYAQSLFGLDLGSGITRYRLLPVRGWEILLAKDIAFLLILIALVLPLSPGPGLTFGFVALALGHHSSVFLRLPHKRWRFAGGRLLPVGAIQALGGIALGFAESQAGPLVLGVAFAGFLASLFWYGRCWDRLNGTAAN